MHRARRCPPEVWDESFGDANYALSPIGDDTPAFGYQFTNITSINGWEFGIRAPDGEVHVSTSSSFDVPDDFPHDNAVKGWGAMAAGASGTNAYGRTYDIIVDLQS